MLKMICKALVFLVTPFLHSLVGYRRKQNFLMSDMTHWLVTCQSLPFCREELLWYCQCPICHVLKQNLITVLQRESIIFWQQPRFQAWCSLQVLCRIAWRLSAVAMTLHKSQWQPWDILARLWEQLQMLAMLLYWATMVLLLLVLFVLQFANTATAEKQLVLLKNGIQVRKISWVVC